MVSLTGTIDGLKDEVIAHLPLRGHIVRPFIEASRWGRNTTVRALWDARSKYNNKLIGLEEAFKEAVKYRQNTVIRSLLELAMGRIPNDMINDFCTSVSSKENILYLSKG